ncbi:hypothetical protein DPEC_G00037890 [Dallia pectoralis]|uniref:Uncharacterized protein n=1 Tax=Dallia pectoralis TaxID=75939 RepID=A0ACC2HEP5_DALPE|nr:hypothetical protein DPEC_G00037890 [Dallia pectoralis]
MQAENFYFVIAGNIGKSMSDEPDSLKKTHWTHMVPIRTLTLICVACPDHTIRRLPGAQKLLSVAFDP